MADIEELQRRITAALERIGKGVDTLDAGTAAADPDEIASLAAQVETLEEQLSDERVTNEQLTERVKTLKQRLEQDEATVKSRIDAQSEATAQIDLELQRLRKVNEQLRENNRALREANEAGIADPHLINKAMSAELEALNAARAAEMAESRAIAVELEQLLDGAAPAATPTEEDA
ncbi:hypothetical protein PGB28_16950 [Primorskyibacter aestuariivivens]|uniref:hypothetical protein n=1 Tax=Primorskyibacter aestuariivivens TaxID=1888912 RepID=UPI0023007D47|nr:hypothetical protein [Primorskyibacter aestuariivivens]MDA7430153.1 hypothetical protein [Primorskyibacter aestuariivivens]